METVDLKEEDLGAIIEDVNFNEDKPISWLPPYMPPWKLTAKVTKDPDAVKFSTCTPLQPEDVPFEGALLTQVPQLCMED